MEPEMSSMFPNGIRALIVDDDAKFLKSATLLLSALNFKVVTCGSPISALRLLSRDKNKDIDVVLAHAEKVATSGFDFRAIIETDLYIPVIYFLSPDHKATGDAADDLLRTLHAATYIMKKPLDINDPSIRCLWRVIAWHKCCMEVKATKSADGNGMAALAGSTMDDKERVHFKVVKGGADRKRKGSNNPAVAGGRPAKRQNVAATKQEKDKEASQQQEQKNIIGRKAKNDGGEASKLFQQPMRAMDKGKQPAKRQPEDSLFVQSVLRTLDVPAFNPKFFTAAAGASSSYVAAFAGASNTAAPPAPALPPVSSQAPAPAPHPWYSAPATTPPQPPVKPAPLELPLVSQPPPPPPTASNVFGNITLPLAADATVTPEPQFACDNLLSQGVCQPLTFGPFPYTGPLPPAMQQQQNMVAPAGDLFAGMAGGGGATIGASSAAATEAGAYCNEVSSFLLQPPSLGAEQDGGGDDLEAMMACMYAMADPPVAVAPHIIVGGGASNEAAAMPGLHGDNFIGNGAGSFFEPDQVIGMADNENGLAIMAGGGGGAFGSVNAASFMAPQEVGMVLPNGDHQQAPGAGYGIYESLMGMGSQDPGAVTDGHAAGIVAPMLPYDQYEDGTLFPLQALLDMPPPLYEFDADMDAAQAQLGGSDSTSTGSAVTAANVAGTSLIGGQDALNNWDDVGAADALMMPDDLFMYSNGDSMFPQYLNNGRE
ncbi:hypothetical protein BS78_02G054100 [Paspalum vaginatum]|nr:hypothetical protein BS78_02G054100 [Paspalum vaginatum]